MIQWRITTKLLQIRCRGYQFYFMFDISGKAFGMFGKPRISARF